MIDISEFGDASEYLRHLSDYCSCPCVRCQRICDNPKIVDNCDAYQLWLDNKWKEREIRDSIRGRKGKINGNQR